MTLASLMHRRLSARSVLKEVSKLGRLHHQRDRDRRCRRDQRMPVVFLWNHAAPFDQANDGTMAVERRSTVHALQMADVGDQPSRRKALVINGPVLLLDGARDPRLPAIESALFGLGAQNGRRIVANQRGRQWGKDIGGVVNRVVDRLARLCIHRLHEATHQRTRTHACLLRCFESQLDWLNITRRIRERNQRPSFRLQQRICDRDTMLLTARFFPEEGTVSTLWSLSDVLKRYGKFCELYMDRGSHHFPYDDAWDHQLTRVLKVLGIRPIYARSPQARGRCERCFGTLQDRWVAEFAFAGITDYDAANDVIQSQLIDDFNRRFTVTPQQSGSAFTALPMTVDLQLLLSVHDRRVVRNDMTVQFNGRRLQLPKGSRCRPKQSVTVHTFVNGSLGISHHDRLVASFQKDGTPHHAVGASAHPGGYLPLADFSTSSTSARPTRGEDIYTNF